MIPLRKTLAAAALAAIALTAVAIVTTGLPTPAQADAVRRAAAHSHGDGFHAKHAHRLTNKTPHRGIRRHHRRHVFRPGFRFGHGFRHGRRVVIFNRGFRHGRRVVIFNRGFRHGRRVVIVTRGIGPRRIPYCLYAGLPVHCGMFGGVLGGAFGFPTHGYFGHRRR